MTNEEISNQLNSLSDRIMLIDDNIKFNIMAFIALLSLVLVASGWALSVLAKRWVEEGVESKLEQLKEEIKTDVNKNFIISHGEAYLQDGITDMEISYSNGEHDSKNPFVSLNVAYGSQNIQVVKITKSEFTISRNSSKGYIHFRWIVLNTFN